MNDIPSRLNLALDGRYRVERELGQGGMATVFLAEDLRHHRRVALKVLKPELAAVVGAERFLAEIRTTANLQHPNILPLYDSGDADGLLFYVMPYVEGETLRERLDREKQLPVEEALRIAGDVADALQAAHEQGVVHRDIKPANILLSRGRPLVADFGIALAVSTAGAGRLTETGLSMGTPYYMSPEQASADRDPDARSDLYSLACVLYEMLSGEPPHTGSTAQAVLARILTENPAPVSRSRASVPVHVDATLTRALQKLPADRFTSAREFAAALRGRVALGESPVPGMPGTDRSPSRAGSLPVMGAVALGALVVGTLLGRMVAGGDAEAPDTVRYTVSPDTTYSIVDLCCGPGLAISLDGNTIIYQAESRTSEVQLYRRSVTDFTGHAVEGTADASTPFISPDGLWIGFVRNQAIQKVPIAGGAAQTVAEVGTNRVTGATWGDDDVITFATAEGLQRVPGNGGPVELWVPNDAEAGRVFSLPHALPGGRTVLATRRNPSSSLADAVVVSVDVGETTERVVTRGLHPHFSAPDHLVFVSPDGAVLAQPFDPRTTALSGAPARVASGILVHTNGDTFFSASRTGSIVYGGDIRGGNVLTRVDRSGLERPMLSRYRLEDPRLSPSGRYVAYTQARDAQSGAEDVWVYDVQQGVDARLSTTEFASGAPAWLDRDRVVFVTLNGPERGHTFVRPADFSRDASSWMDFQEDFVNPGTGFAGNGRVAYTRSLEGGQDIWTATTEGTDPQPFLATDFQEGRPAFSPDGRWIAYESNESGSIEIYVLPYPGPGPRTRISLEGGADPRWTRGGAEIMYRTPGLGVAAAQVREDDGALVVESREVLPIRPFGGTGGFHTWDVSADGESLLLIRDGASSDLLVELNVVGREGD